MKHALMILIPLVALSAQDAEACGMRIIETEAEQPMLLADLMSEIDAEPAEEAQAPQTLADVMLEIDADLAPTPAITHNGKASSVSQPRS